MLVVRLASWLSVVYACSHPAHSVRLLAELHFLAPRASSLLAECAARELELELADRARMVILTAPPIFESEWRVRACGRELRLTLDCSTHDGVDKCWEHFKPRGAGIGEDPLERAFADPLEREFDAVAEEVRPCPAEHSCLRNRSCADDGLTMRRTGQGAWQLLRCDETRTVPLR